MILERVLDGINKEMEMEMLAIILLAVMQL